VGTVINETSEVCFTLSAAQVLFAQVLGAHFLKVLKANNSAEYIFRGAFHTLTSLTELSLRNNGIVVITDNTFAGFTQLTILDFGNNNISAISKETFEGLIQLTFLDLGGNQITLLAGGAFTVPCGGSMCGLYITERCLLETTTSTAVPTLTASTCRRGSTVNRSVCSMTPNTLCSCSWRP
jgi:hypothetical protein